MSQGIKGPKLDVVPSDDVIRVPELMQERLPANCSGVRVTVCL